MPGSSERSLAIYQGIRRHVHKIWRVFFAVFGNFAAAAYKSRISLL